MYKRLKYITIEIAQRIAEMKLKRRMERQAARESARRTKQMKCKYSYFEIVLLKLDTS